MRKPIYEGTRWSLVYGSYEGVEKFAVNELQKTAQLYLPYMIETRQGTGEVSGHKGHLILAGTASDNKLIGELVKKGLLSIPSKPEGYVISCFNSPWSEGKRVIAIAGSDPNGVLYGVEDFNAKILSHESFDNVKDFTISDYPRIENRGIWTWGYVIYDYRRFIDNMARLKMNMLAFWNDCPPENCREVIDYAHSRGIKAVLGFHWGWGMDDIDLSNAEHRARIKGIVLDNYNNNYRGLGMDGIYFQTLTEHENTRINGRSVASIVCDMVNDISSGLFKDNPGLYIQFGLHATSIKDSYEDLKSLDPRITIMWEDAGGVVYPFIPSELEFGPGSGENKLRETIEYSKKLANLRNGAEFAMVPKGWTCIDWKCEFEHHGKFIMGERHHDYIHNRLAQKQPYWDKVNSAWVKEQNYAAEFYREIRNCTDSKMTVLGLIEDGMFEEKIQPSVEMFAKTIWDPFAEHKK